MKRSSTSSNEYLRSKEMKKEELKRKLFPNLMKKNKWERNHSQLKNENDIDFDEHLSINEVYIEHVNTEDISNNEMESEIDMSLLEDLNDFFIDTKLAPHHCNRLLRILQKHHSNLPTDRETLFRTIGRRVTEENGVQTLAKEIRALKVEIDLKIDKFEKQLAAVKAEKHNEQNCMALMPEESLELIQLPLNSEEELNSLEDKLKTSSDAKEEFLLFLDTIRRPLQASSWSFKALNEIFTQDFIVNVRWSSMVAIKNTIFIQLLLGKIKFYCVR